MVALSQQIDREASTYVERVERVEEAAVELRRIVDQTAVTPAAVDESAQRALHESVIALPRGVPVDRMPAAIRALRTLTEDFRVVTSGDAVATATRLEVEEIRERAKRLRAQIEARSPPPVAISDRQVELERQRTRSNQAMARVETSATAAQYAIEETRPRSRALAMALGEGPTRLAVQNVDRD